MKSLPPLLHSSPPPSLPSIRISEALCALVSSMEIAGIALKADSTEEVYSSVNSFPQRLPWRIRVIYLSLVHCSIGVLALMVSRHERQMRDVTFM